MRIRQIKQQKQTLATDIISALFILLFLYASVSKLSDLEKFRIQTGKSPILNFMAEWVVWMVPIAELLICTALVIKRLQFIALYASFGIMVMFTVYIIIILNFSSYIPCSCGGILENMSWRQHLIFNLCFTALAAVGVLIYPTTNEKLISIRGEAENLIE